MQYSVCTRCGQVYAELYRCSTITPSSLLSVKSCLIDPPRLSYLRWIREVTLAADMDPVCSRTLNSAAPLTHLFRAHLRRRYRQKADILLGTSPSPVVLTMNTVRLDSNICATGTASSGRAQASKALRLAIVATYSATSF